ncbi:MAG: FAD-dependent oxidoreductase, partial [Gemmobacter sp.]
IASGSEPAPLAGAAIDETTVVTSTGALELGTIPGTMVVIGGGVIGLELGSVYARLGTAVTVIEYLDHLIPGNDGEVQKAFERILKKQGLKFELGAAVQGVTRREGGATVAWQRRKDQSLHEASADIVLVATGRRPFVQGLGLDALGVQMTPRGQIAVDRHFATSVPGIYAIGDAIPGPMLAHK